MRVLAIDLGQKRTGLAVGSDVTGIVTPLKLIEAASDHLRLDAIAAAITQHEPDTLVLGYPLNMDGSEGKPARLMRHFAEQLENRFELPVHLVDERKSSEAANAKMARTGLTHGQKKQRRDGLAASEILSRFLKSLGENEVE